MPKKCSNCGETINDDVKFCQFCGAPVPNSNQEPEPNNELSKETEPIVESNITAESNSQDVIETNSYSASNSSGEALLGNDGEKSLDKSSGVIPSLGKVLGTSVKSFISSIKSLFKDPKKLILPLAIAVIWIVLDILKSCGINPIPTQILSFLTFANGGMNGGIIGAIGGVIGKCIFVTAIVSLIGLIKNRNKGQKFSFANIFKGSFGVQLDTLGAYLLGAGIAMFFFLFISGGATRISFMGGIAVSFLAAKNAQNNGFLRKVINSITSKGKTKEKPDVIGFIRGIAAGAAASSLIGLIGINLIIIIMGGLLVIGGIVLIILKATGVLKFGKEAKVQ